MDQCIYGVQSLLKKQSYFESGKKKDKRVPPSVHSDRSRLVW